MRMVSLQGSASWPGAPEAHWIANVGLLTHVWWTYQHLDPLLLVFLQAVSCLSFADGGSVLVSGGEDTLLAAWSLGACLDQGARGAGGMQGTGQRVTALHTW